MVEVIIGGFVGRGINNNARKRHLQVLMVVENKKVKPKNVEGGLVILFSDKDYLEGFNREHNNLIVITTNVYNYIVK